MFPDKLIFAALVLATCSTNNSLKALADQRADADKDTVSTKHFHFPFVHVDTVIHKDGTKDVDVKAPFTKVHNPAGANNAQVKAPFTKVDNGQKANSKNTQLQSSANNRQTN